MLVWTPCYPEGREDVRRRDRLSHPIRQKRHGEGDRRRRGRRESERKKAVKQKKKKQKKRGSKK